MKKQRNLLSNKHGLVLILLMGISFYTYAQPGTTNHYVYEGQPSFSADLGKSQNETRSKGSYQQGTVVIDCNTGSTLSDNRTTVNCGTVEATWESMTHTITSGNNGETDEYPFRYTRPAYDDGAISNVDDQGCVAGRNFIEYSGSCTNDVDASIQQRDVDIEVTTLRFTNTVTLVEICESDDPINLESTAFWNRISVPKDYGGMSFEGPGVSGSTFDPDGLSGSVTVVGKLKFWNGEAIASISINVVDVNVNAGSQQQGCANTGEVVLNAPTSGVIWSCVSCDYVSDGKFDTNAAPPGSYTVRATKTSNGCQGFDDKTFIVTSQPNVDAGNDITLCEDASAFTLDGETPNNVGTWSASCGSCVSGAIFDPAIAGVGDHTITYTYENVNGCSASDTRNVRIKALPEAELISVSNDERCGPGIVSLQAEYEDNTIRWYDSETGGSILETGNTYEPTVSNTGVTQYWVDQVSDQGCVSNSRKLVTATVYEVPSDPVAFDKGRCSSGSVTLEATGGITNASYRWYENPSGGSPIATGSSFTTPNLSSSRSYYVDALSPDGCVSPGRTKVDVNINDNPSKPSVSDRNICGSGSATFQANGGPAGANYRWYDEPTGGNLVETGPIFTTPLLEETTSYYATVVTEFGCESNREEVVAVVNSIPEIPTVEDVSRCDPGSIELTATGGADFEWYFNASGGSAFATGSSITIENLNETTTYYVAAKSAAGCLSPRESVVATMTPITPVEIGSDFEICVNAGAFDLSDDLSDVSSNDGFFTGPGVISEEFYPSVAGVGTHEITFVLTEDLGCKSDGTRFITVKDTNEGVGLSFNEESLQLCEEDNGYDLNQLVNVSGGSWTSSASGAVTLGIFDPSIAGSGEHSATYTIDLNGCVVSNSLDIVVLEVPDKPTVNAPQFICDNSVFAQIGNVDPDLIYKWYVEGETSAFATGSSVGIDLDETTTYKVEAESVFGCVSESTFFTVSISGGEVSSSSTTYDIGELVKLTYKKETDFEITQYTWKYDNGVTSNSETGNYYYYVPGTYVVELEIVTSDDCQLNYEYPITIREDNDELVLSSESTEFSENKTVIYPNPFADVIKMRSTEKTVLKILDISGQVIKEEQIGKGLNIIRTSGLSKGVYFTRFITGGEVQTFKIVKQ